MKNIWKWILGIVLVLVVVTVIAVPFVMHHKLGVNFAQAGMSYHHSGDGPRNDPMHGEFRGGHGMGKVGGFGSSHHRAMHFGPGLFLLGGLMRLVPLALFTLLLIGVYQLGKRATAIRAVAVAPVIAPTHTCPKCGNAVHDDWKHCPSCGRKQ